MKFRISILFFMLMLSFFSYTETVEIFPQGYYHKFTWEWCKNIEKRDYCFNDANAEVSGWNPTPYYLGLKDCFYIPYPVDEPDHNFVSRGYVKINRNSVVLNKNGFKEFVLKDKTCACIDGGGFFAANVPYMYKDSDDLDEEDYTEFTLDGKNIYIPKITTRLNLMPAAVYTETIS